MRKKVKLVWHPESPGMKMMVFRNWWQRLWRPKNFATLGEALRHAERGLSLLDERTQNLKEFNTHQPDECYPTKLD